MSRICIIYMGGTYLRRIAVKNLYTLTRIVKNSVIVDELLDGQLWSKKRSLTSYGTLTFVFSPNFSTFIGFTNLRSCVTEPDST